MSLLFSLYYSPAIDSSLGNPLYHTTKNSFFSYSNKSIFDYLHSFRDFFNSISSCEIKTSLNYFFRDNFVFQVRMISVINLTSKSYLPPVTSSCLIFFSVWVTPTIDSYPVSQNIVRGWGILYFQGIKNSAWLTDGPHPSKNKCPIEQLRI